MYITLRKATPDDWMALWQMEQIVFPAFQQTSLPSLKKSLQSNSQEVWLAEIRTRKGIQLAGSLVVHLRKKTLRIFSIGVLPKFQGKGVGLKLLNQAFSRSLAAQVEKISLEANAADEKLIRWYTNKGFVIKATLPDYYAEGKSAYRMVYSLYGNNEKQQIENIIVVDNLQSWKFNLPGVRVITAKHYMSDPEFQIPRNVRIFNLCNSYRYQKTGYYVSLLASAREHRAIPNVTTIEDFRNPLVVRALASDIDELMQETFKKETANEVLMHIFFERTIHPGRRQLGQRLYHLFEAPLLEVYCVRNERWTIQKVVPLSLRKMSEADLNRIQEFAAIYFAKKRFFRPKLKQYQYSLAILINPTEENPPSDPGALVKFKKAAQKLGFFTEFITKADLSQIAEYDALFIRETTDITNHTYRFSRLAYAEGLVVIDDPWSILRCSNKIFINERMKQNRINTPATWVLNKESFRSTSFKESDYPLVIKQPDSSFSKGVMKANSQSELEHITRQLFKHSDLLVAQEFLPSEFDWRIGVLDQEPLFACKYFMAKDHWQIYNWKGDDADQSGDFETLPVESVPKHILKVAVKAAALMGDGLYGIDLKEVNGKIYIIEVNDNPNIDEGVEDLFLKDVLYERIIRSFLNRIEMSRNMARFVSLEPDH